MQLQRSQISNLMKRFLYDCKESNSMELKLLLLVEQTLTKHGCKLLALL